ncbi:MAG: cryptochrome/photolyase family protein [Candidatus Competibacteraceae bacterium]|jgi:deoxyribodipyrimidine photolyase-related protein|nr:cryptochrome/photolyase family protein [Candidatus Competibacteraceae bacterium]
MTTLRLVLGDQLSRSISALSDIDHANDVVLMMEVHDETTYVRHHKQKLVLVLSAMRHFAQSLRAEGIDVDYVELDSKGNSGSFTGELKRALSRHSVTRIIVTEPSEWRVWDMMQRWSIDFSLPVEIRENDRFLCSRTEFAAWAKGRISLRMEFFYREMRRKTGWLMNGDKPEGEQWNYDAENRKALPKNVAIPPRHRFTPDAITRDVIKLISQRFADHFGDVDSFAWGVIREDALKALNHFVEQSLPRFGDYQDAMKAGDDFLFHSVLSPYLNIGLLNPREVCETALVAYQVGHAPLHAVEGFIRQILGWREYIRGIYWLHMPDYAQSNFFNATRPLPDFYWTGETDLNCLREAIRSTRRNAYAHHIQRLMITGNFALLAGIAPDQVEEWYLIVYADAFDWVELPNTHGMALHADGGLLGSKPYAASGAYIDRMSDYCTGCVYSPKVKLGSKACPFNYLYWFFLINNEDLLKTNPRMAMPYRNLARMTEDRRQQIVQQAEAFLAQ